MNKEEILKEFEETINMSKLKALSKHSLEHPLTNSQFEEMFKRLEELEELAKRNRDKFDDTPLTDWLNDEEREEYERLFEEYNQ